MTTMMKKLPKHQHEIILAMAAGAQLRYHSGYIYHSTIINPSYKLYTDNADQTARKPSVDKLAESGFFTKMEDKKYTLSDLGKQYAAQFAA